MNTTLSKKCLLEDLPEQVNIEIISKVASDSIRNVNSVKLSCKNLMKITYNDYVLRKANLEKLSVSQWHVNESRNNFMQLCEESGNPEALYRKGIVHLFQEGGTIQAINYLRQANKAGHLEAPYALGDIPKQRLPDCSFRQQHVKRARG
ncbi:hypothetical protein LIER_04564 [Lithospermum erythrorhizon]|uniref:At2g35280-like TPR domain-containing protein n=1 Tax=Lithospermum erythrorhizon TaxID=34254 RepID=A0AAV3NX57_LITER